MTSALLSFFAIIPFCYGSVHEFNNAKEDPFNTTENANSSSSKHLDRHHGRFQRSSGLSAADIQALVDSHNSFRRQMGASNMMKMRWDPQLANNAQAYANLCTLAHSANRVNAGENIWAGVWYPPSLGSVATAFWFDEGRRCGCGNGYQYCCGHYSQLIWATSTRMGCGFASCNSVRNTATMKYVLVCQYSPAGNKVGAAAYQAGPACASCPGGTKCDNGLCA